MYTRPQKVYVIKPVEPVTVKPIESRPDEPYLDELYPFAYDDNPGKIYWTEYDPVESWDGLGLLAVLPKGVKPPYHRATKLEDCHPIFKSNKFGEVPITESDLRKMNYYNDSRLAADFQLRVHSYRFHFDDQDEVVKTCKLKDDVFEIRCFSAAGGG
ncbi:hypothetical protein TWF718_004648 [Orbilia javanica]|uniref:Uncharacterized protein n=1 Tax=Orbilia javanica TaxID=47235 RepID=A0AAN8RL80_9PEZI